MHEDYNHDNVIFRVKLAINRDTQEAVAVKIVDLEKSANVEKNIRKEASGN